MWGEKEVCGKLKRKKDCWRDCDFPSECLNERVREREDERLRRVLEKEEMRSRWVERDGDGDVEMPDSYSSISEPSPSSFYESEDSKDDLERDGQSGDAGETREVEEENLGPIGTDSDGLGEEKLEYSACRRKSLDAGETPRSPLKESFGVADVEGGWGKGMERILL